MRSSSVWQIEIFSSKTCSHYMSFLIPADDSHEFLRVLMDHLSDGLKDCARCQDSQSPATEQTIESMSIREKSDYFHARHLAQNASFVTDEFCGQLISTVTCRECQASRHSFDAFYDLSLPIPEGGASSRKHRKRPSLIPVPSYFDVPDECHIDECMHEYTRDEVLDGDNMIQCTRCGGKRESVKRLKVFKVSKQACNARQHLFSVSPCPSVLT